MSVMHLGVFVVPYPQEEPAPKVVKSGKRTKPVAATVHVSAETTGDVATWLENKYHIMEQFSGLHRDDIAKDLEVAMGDAIENMMKGAPPVDNPVEAATSDIEKRFRKFLFLKEMDALGYPGIPTRAAQEGISHRFKNKKGPPRPSFIDTGTFETAFRAWMNDKEPAA